MNKRMLSLTIIALISGTILMVLLDWHQLDFPPCSNYLSQFCVVSLAMWSLTQANILWCVCLSFNMMKTIKVQQKVAYKWLENY